MARTTAPSLHRGRGLPRWDMTRLFTSVGSRELVKAQEALEDDFESLSRA